MANEFKIKHGFISTGNGEVQGTLDVSTGININAQPVATRAWVTGTALASYATSQDVTDAINALVDSAPGTLNTLNELAAALGDDASFSTTITNSIATKLPLAGGTMSGDIKILYNDHASGAGYDTQLYIGKSDTLGLQGAFPTYVPAGSYGFFSHASSDGVFFGSVPVSAGASNYYATIAWGDDATEYLQFLYKGSQKAYLTTDGHFYIDGSFYSNGAIVATQAWVSAQSFITGYTETDPVFSASAAAGVTTALIDKWNDAFSWGNHADGGYLAASSYTAADILTKIKTVDGAGSGLDADYIDGLTSSQFLRSDTAGILTYNTSTSETLKFANNTSGGLIQLGFQQNDADGMHHRAYLKAYKSAAGSVAGKFDIIIRSVGGGTTADIFELEAGAKAKWQGNNLATETFASDEAAAVQDNLDSLVGSLGTAAYTASTAYASASHTHSYLPLSGGTLTGQVIFPSAATTKPVFPSGFISRNDSSDGNHDIWGISERYYPSNSTAADAWGIRWNGDNNDVQFVGAGTNRVVISLDEGNITTTGTLTASGYNASNWDTAYGWGNHANAGYGSAGDTAKGVEAFGWGDHAAAGYLTSYSESDTLATVTARGNTTNGSINVNGDILLTGTATTTNQGRMIDFTGFDKEGTTDFSDRAYIQHTVNTGGHSGSVLVISSQNDSGDGIAFLTNASSKLKHNSNNIATENWVAAQGYLTSLPAHTHPISEIDGLQDELDGKQPAGSYLTTSGKAADSNLLDGIDSGSFLRSDANDTASGNLYFSSSYNRFNTGNSNNTSTADTVGVYLHQSGYTDGRWTTRLRKYDHGGGVPLYIDNSAATANVFTAAARFGTYSGNGYTFEVFGAARINGDLASSGQINASGGNSSQWNAAYSWGDHAGLYGSAGDTAKGVEAFGWGDHSAAGYITDGNTNWNNSYGFITASDSITGNAATATKLATARSIGLAGDVTGSANFDGSANISITATVANDSHTHDGRYYTESESDARFVNVTGDTVTGNLAVSGASLSVTSTAAGSEAFYVDGVNGRLFTISDDLSDSLFSVNTISGLPVIEAFADNTVKIGPFSNPVTVDSSGVLAIGGVTAATQTYVDNAITGLIGGAPGALDTLNELAAAINDDASYASTITTALGTKAPLASPALTGTPTAPTAAAATNSTQIATTAFVKSQGYLTSLPAHTHPIGEIEGLQDELDGKQPAGSYLTSYTETDTLNSVLVRGNSSGTQMVLTATDVAFKAQSNGTSSTWRGRLGTFNSSTDASVFLGTYGAKQGVFGHNNALTAWDDLWLNTLGTSGQGNVYLSWNTYVKGSSSDTNYTLWHSGNDGAGSGLDADLLDGSSWESANKTVRWSGSGHHGNPRSMAIGYSGGNYGQFGYGLEFTGTSGVHNYAINDVVTRVDMYGGLVVYGAAGGTVGTNINWTETFRARYTDSAPTFKGNTIWHAGNDGASSGLDADTVDGLHASSFASSSHNHDSRYMRADTDANTAGAIRINGSYSYGTYTAASNYKTGADNLVLKGNASGVSGIFFESEKDGTNINHPSDFGFIQYSAYGTGTSGESNELIIGVSNDADDHLVFNAPDTNGLKFRIGASTTDNTVYHSGNLTLATLGYTGATNANYITNNNQLTNGAGYITSFDITTQTDPKYLRSNAADTAGGLITFAAGIDMANTNISGVNHISINDAGWGEGIQWDSWLICESPDDLTNAAGNLQFANTVDNGVRVTLNTDGAFYPGKDRLQDLGQPDARWRVVFCETLDSAGLHESNLASDTTGFHATGTVLVWKDGEAVPCTTEADHMKIGVAVFGNSSPLVQGAEPVLVSGEVREGDYLITSEVVGHAKAVSRSYVIENQLLDCVIGKALETASGESHLVKTWVTI